MRPFARVLTVLLAALVGCSDPVTLPPVRRAIYLSAQEATAIKGRIELVAAAYPEVAWLADSVSLFIGKGARVDTMPITADYSSATFYGIAFSRYQVAPGVALNSFAAVVFDEPTNPTEFILIEGRGIVNTVYDAYDYFRGPVVAPGPYFALSARIFRVGPERISSWRPTQGTAEIGLADSDPREDCPFVAKTAALTCLTMGVYFKFSIVAEPLSGADGMRTVSSVPGYGGLLPSTSQHLPGISLRSKQP